MRGFSKIILLISLAFVSCSSKTISFQNSNADTTKTRFHVEEATEWTNLFYRNSGWVGADGIFSIPLNGIDSCEGGKDTSTLFLFSDTILGEIENQKFSNGFRMINNSVAVLKGINPLEQNINFFWKQTVTGQDRSVFIPGTKQRGAKDYYWLGDGFVNRSKKNNIYIFASRIQNVGTGVFGFKEVGNALLVVPSKLQAPFDSVRQIDMDIAIEKNSVRLGSFGSGLLVNDKASGSKKPDGYLYVYGVIGKNKEVVVARVKPSLIEQQNQWKYWNGKTWGKDQNQAVAIAARASNELSVTPLPNGKFVMVFQVDGMSNTIGMRFGESPAGPFGPIIPVWDCSADTKIDKDFFAYNAKAHPSLSKRGELLITYNLNSFDSFNDLLERPNHYRPRFIKLVWDK